jgi:hypothetical protein
MPGILAGAERIFRLKTFKPILIEHWDHSQKSEPAGL